MKARGCRHFSLPEWIRPIPGARNSRPSGCSWVIVYLSPALYEESLQALLHMTRGLVTKGKEIDFRTVSATLPIHNWDARWRESG